MTSTIDKVKISYKDKDVTAHKLTVTSEIPIDIDTCWAKIKTSSLLEFIVKGKVKLKPTGGQYPETWIQGDTIATKMWIYGFIPLGVHTIYFEKIDNQNKILHTKERNNIAKVWNHKISLKIIDNKTTLYKDEIIIYGEIITGLIACWAKFFYKHRQKRWQIIAKNIVT